MNTDNRDEKLFPEEIAVDEIIQDASKRLEQIDFWKRNLPPLSGPSPHPSGFSHEGWTEAKREHYKKTLEYRQDFIRAEAKEKAVKVLEKSPLEVQLLLYNKIDNWAEPKIEGEKNLDQRGATAKDISSSQDIAMLKLYDRKKENMLREQLKPQGGLANSVEPDQAGSQSLSLAETYDASLHYNDVFTGNDKSPEKSDKDIEPDPSLD